MNKDILSNISVTNITNNAIQHKNEEASMRTMLNLIQVGCYELDTSANILFVNRQALEWLGAKETDVVGKCLWSIFPIDLDKKFYQLIQERTLNNRQRSHLEIFSPVMGRWVAITAAPSDKGCFIELHDIDGRKYIEDKLAQRATDKYYSLFNSIDEGFCVLELVYGADGTIKDLIFREQNSSFDKHTGLGYVIGKSIKKLLPNFEQYWIDIYSQVAETGKVLRGENFVQDVGRWYSAHFLRVGDHENTYVAVIFEDISSRKMAELGLNDSKKRQTFLLELSDTLRTETEFERVGKRAAHMIAGKLDVDRVYLVTLMPDSDHIVAKYEARRENMLPLSIDYRGSDFPAAFAEVFERTIAYEDVRTDSRLTAIDRMSFAEMGAVSLIAVPIRHGNETMIFTGVALSSQPRAWSSGEVTLFEYAIERTWAAIERAKAEQNEEKHRTLSETINEGFAAFELIRDERGKLIDLVYTEVNPMFEQYSGMKAVVGKRISELLPSFEHNWFQVLQLVSDTGEPVRSEKYSVDLDRWFDFRCSCIGKPGSPYIAAVFSDITERKHNEKRQAYLLKLSDALRSLSDANQIEDTTCQILGEYLNASHVYYPEINESDNCIKVARQYLRKGASSMEGTYSFEANSVFLSSFSRGEAVVIDDIHQTENIPASEVAVLASMQQVAIISVPLIKNGELVSALSVAESKRRHWRQDEVELIRETLERMWAVAERSRAENALRESQIQLQKLVKIRDEFIGNASHELKTPLTSIMVYLDILGEELSAMTNRRYSTMIEKSIAQVSRLNMLVSNMLDVGRVHGGKMLLSISSFDLGELIQEKADELQRITKKHTILLQLAPPLDVVAERERIGQVIINLLTNAIKYSPAGGDILIAAELDDSNIRVTVTDHGMGIPTIDLGSVFDRFFRVDSPIVKTFPGMGIGLTICKAIVEVHNGSISVTSEEGVGSSFTFAIPKNGASLDSLV